MAWFMRMTRFGDVHMCFAQEQNISCGVASVIMAAFKVNKLKPKVKTLFSEEDIMKLAESLFGPNPLGANGLNGKQIMKLLEDPLLKMPGWTLMSPGADNVTEQIKKHVGVTDGWGPTVDSTPLIMLVQWKGTQDRHWVVIDTIRRVGMSEYATVCDPWDGSVHVIPITGKKRFAYAAKQVIDWDFWGKRDFGYGKPAGEESNSDRLSRYFKDDGKTVSNGTSTISWQDNMGNPQIGTVLIVKNP